MTSKKYVPTISKQEFDGIASTLRADLKRKHDRMHEQDFNLSHEFLAVMLGVRRPTVSIAAAALQEAGLIRYTHGWVTVRNRKGLKMASCECYASIRAQFDRLRH